MLEKEKMWRQGLLLLKFNYRYKQSQLPKNVTNLISLFLINSKFFHQFLSFNTFFLQLRFKSCQFFLHRINQIICFEKFGQASLRENEENGKIQIVTEKKHTTIKYLESVSGGDKLLPFFFQHREIQVDQLEVWRRCCVIMASQLFVEP